MPTYKLSGNDVINIQNALARGERVTDLANKYDVSRPTIYKIKSGVRNPNGNPDRPQSVTLSIDEAKALLDSYNAMVAVAKQHLGSNLHPLVDVPKKHFGGILEERIARAEGK